VAEQRTKLTKNTNKTPKINLLFDIRYITYKSAMKFEEPTMIFFDFSLRPLINQLFFDCLDLGIMREMKKKTCKAKDNI
jgi:hypothetical protein